MERLEEDLLSGRCHLALCGWEIFICQGLDLSMMMLSSEQASILMHSRDEVLTYSLQIAMQHPYHYSIVYQDYIDLY